MLIGVKMPARRIFFVAIMLFSVMRITAPAQQSGDKIYLGELHILHSTILNEDRPFLIYLPDGYARSEEHFPVLYLLDGVDHFHHVTGLVQFMAARQLMPEVIVVALANTDRNRDFLPTPDPSGRIPSAGGADNFLKFLRDELLPFIDQNFRTYSYRILVGHSYGGLLTIYALLNQPDLFQAHLAISPTLDWDNHLAKHLAEDCFRAHPALKN